MNLLKVARIASLCLIVVATAVTSFANYPGECDCHSCAMEPDRTCSTQTSMEVTVWTCSQWLAQSQCGQTCETVTDCQSNADCFGGLCTRMGICLCPGGGA